MMIATEAVITTTAAAATPGLMNHAQIERGLASASSARALSRVLIKGGSSGSGKLRTASSVCFIASYSRAHSGQEAMCSSTSALRSVGRSS